MSNKVVAIENSFEIIQIGHFVEALKSIGIDTSLQMSEYEKKGGNKGYGREAVAYINNLFYENYPEIIKSAKNAQIDSLLKAPVEDGALGSMDAIRLNAESNCTKCLISCTTCAIDAVCICFSLTAFRATLSGSRLTTLASKACKIIENGILKPLKIALNEYDVDSVGSAALLSIKIVTVAVGLMASAEIISLIFQDMSWWEYILYGTVVGAELAAAFATDGASLAVIAGINAV